MPSTRQAADLLGTNLDSAFYGSGAATRPAIFNGQKGTLLVRDIAATGYACAVSNHTSAVPGLALVEWVSKPVVTQFPSAGVTLRLEVRETPDVPDDPPN
ncbi:MAG: hypothetical protein NTV22_04530, partial [bacterium]|nr:hypothetical protein [bacterium]